jgi:hypothetical protein
MRAGKTDQSRGRKFLVFVRTALAWGMDVSLRSLLVVILMVTFALMQYVLSRIVVEQRLGFTDDEVEETVPRVMKNQAILVQTSIFLSSEAWTSSFPAFRRCPSLLIFSTLQSSISFCTSNSWIYELFFGFFSLLSLQQLDRGVCPLDGYREV